MLTGETWEIRSIYSVYPILILKPSKDGVLFRHSSWTYHIFYLFLHLYYFSETWTRKVTSRLCLCLGNGYTKCAERHCASCHASQQRALSFPSCLFSYGLLVFSSYIFALLPPCHQPPAPWHDTTCRFWHSCSPNSSKGHFLGKVIRWLDSRLPLPPWNTLHIIPPPKDGQLQQFPREQGVVQTSLITIHTCHSQRYSTHNGHQAHFNC